MRDAVESGRVSAPNARRLAEAIEKTSADAVEADSELLANAESMRPEQFTREARRWTSDRQDDGGEGDYQRMRARRCVRVWDADDGMVRVHGEFDPVSGRRVANRLQAAARRMYDADKKQAAGNGSGRRSFNQCMADALDSLTSDNSTGSGSGAGKAFADICVVAHVDDATGKLVAELPDGCRLPQSVLEEIACNAKFTGVVYDRKGKPIWRAQSVSVATEAQRQLLIAQYGGCFHCQANPAVCQIHHIKPVSQGGATSIKNMVPVCWGCHDKIHYDDWQIRTSLDGIHTLHPPDRVNYGPARAPEDPVLHLPARAPEDPTPHLPGIAPEPDPVPPRLPAGTAGAPERSELHQPGTAQAPEPDPVPPRLPAGTAGAPERSELHQPGTAQAPEPDPVLPQSPAGTTAAPEGQTLHQPGTAQAPDPPPLEPHSSRSESPGARAGPAAARAALRNARAMRSGTLTERAPRPPDVHAGPPW